MLGDTINTQQMIHDYSGYVNAGKIQAQGVSDFGKAATGAVDTVVQGYKDNKASEARRDALINGIDSLAKAFPSQAEYYKGVKSHLIDPNMTMSQRNAALDQAEKGMTNYQNLHQQGIVNALNMQRVNQQGGSGQGVPPDLTAGLDVTPDQTARQTTANTSTSAAVAPSVTPVSSHTNNVDVSSSYFPSTPGYNNEAEAPPVDESGFHTPSYQESFADSFVRQNVAGKPLVTGSTQSNQQVHARGASGKNIPNRTPSSR